MKKRLAFILCTMFAAVLITAFVCRAADVTFSWNAQGDATGYILEMSTDNGATWTNPTDVGNVTTYTWLGIPDNGLVLFRNTAYKTTTDNATVRPEAGAWYNGDWLPVAPPGGTGVE